MCLLMLCVHVCVCMCVCAFVCVCVCCIGKYVWCLCGVHVCMVFIHAITEGSADLFLNNIIYCQKYQDVEIGGSFLGM